jgi:hypothetical protein
MESSSLEYLNLEKWLDHQNPACFGLPEKPLRISITVILLVLNVEFKIDMLPRLRKTGPESASHFRVAQSARNR